MCDNPYRCSRRGNRDGNCDGTLLAFHDPDLELASEPALFPSGSPVIEDGCSPSSSRSNDVHRNMEDNEGHVEKSA